MLVAAGCALPLGACTTWRDQPPPLPTVRRTIDGPVRVTRRDGYSIVLDAADVRGDSIVGISQLQKRRVSIALDDATRVEQRRDNVIGTVALVVSITAAALGLYVHSIFSDPNY